MSYEAYGANVAKLCQIIEKQIGSANVVKQSLTNMAKLGATHDFLDLCALKGLWNWQTKVVSDPVRFTVALTALFL